MGRKSSLNMGGGRMQLAIGSQGWQDLFSGVNSEVNGKGGKTGRLLI